MGKLHSPALSPPPFFHLSNARSPYSTFASSIGPSETKRYVSWTDRTTIDYEDGKSQKIGLL